MFSYFEPEKVDEFWSAVQKLQARLNGDESTGSDKQLRVVVTVSEYSADISIAGHGFDSLCVWCSEYHSFEDLQSTNNLLTNAAEQLSESLAKVEAAK